MDSWERVLSRSYTAHAFRPGRTVPAALAKVTRLLWRLLHTSMHDLALDFKTPAGLRVDQAHSPALLYTNALKGAGACRDKQQAQCSGTAGLET